MSEYEIYSYEAFRKRTRDDIRVAENIADEEILELMGITNDGNPTLAGLMTFSKYPQGYFPQLCITAVSIPGTEQGTAGTDGHRADKPEYPIKAVREAILNALVHRDYSIHTENVPIRIEIYRDRMEIFSVVHGEFKVVMKNGLFTETMPTTDSIVEFYCKRKRL